MSKIIYTSNGQGIIVDDDSYESLNGHLWHIDKGRTTSYARRNSPRVAGKQTGIVMHRVILNAKPGEQVDHINHDGLDNRTENLRICTNRENQRNAKVRSDNVSGYKGVRTNGRCRWMARVRIDGEQIYLGSFASPEAAARAYDGAAIKHFREFARLNFPTGKDGEK